MTTVAGIHQGLDTHANRPAATAVTAGTLYSCSDHSLIYISDGSTWSTYATLGGTDSDAIHDNVASEISALTLVTAASGDHVLIEDASDSNNKKRVAASDFLSGGGSTVEVWLEEEASDSAATSLDEFSDASFTGWTLIEPTSSAQTITEGKGLLSIKPTSSIPTTDFNCMVKANAISTGDAIEIAVHSAISDDVPTIAFGPVMTDGTATTSNIVAFTCQLFASDSELYFYQGTGTVTNITQATGIGLHMVPIQRLYMRLEHDASNSFKQWISTDRLTWHLLATISTTLTPSHIGFGWSTFATTPVFQNVTISSARTVTV